MRGPSKLLAASFGHTLISQGRSDTMCQSSSGVEQRTHKPLVGGSIPPSGTNFFTPHRLHPSARIDLRAANLMP